MEEEEEEEKVSVLLRERGRKIRGKGERIGLMREE